jgi:type IV secretion system protein VirB2
MATGNFVNFTMAQAPLEAVVPMEPLSHRRPGPIHATIGKAGEREHYPAGRRIGMAGRGKAVLRKYIGIWATLAALPALLASTAASAQDTLADPAGSGVIVAAVRWLEGTLLGTIATVVAVMAVATVGLLMLTGRINWRYGATVILGCFILFGAASIVAGIQSTASLGN